MKQTVYENPISAVDIHKIIDDAMTHKDRTVSVFISNIGTTINVTPLDENKDVWTPFTDDRKTKTYYSCSSCNRPSDQPYPYCPWCGDAVSLPDLEKQKKYATSLHKKKTDNLRKFVKEKNDV